MPEAAAAAAPAAPAAPSATQSTPQQGQSPAPPEKPTAAEAVVESWTPDDDALFSKLAKKAGWKVKANGKEQPITSASELLKEFEFSAKGRGAAKLTEQAKKEAEAAKQAAAEAANYRALVEAARSGDWNARVELGLVSPDEVQAQEAELAKYPPEVRQLLQRNQELERLAAEAQAEKERFVAEQKKAREETLRESIRKQATDYLQKVLESSGLDLSVDGDEARPFLASTLQAMQEFSQAGLDLAADTTADMVVRRAAELRHEASERAFGKLKPEKRLAHARTILETMADEVFGAQGPDGKATPGTGDVKRIADALGPKALLAAAKTYAALKKVATQQAATQTPAQPPKAEEKPPERKPLWFGAVR